MIEPSESARKPERQLFYFPALEEGPWRHSLPLDTIISANEEPRVAATMCNGGTNRPSLPQSYVEPHFRKWRPALCRDHGSGKHGDHHFRQRMDTFTSASADSHFAEIVGRDNMETLTSAKQDGDSHFQKWRRALCRDHALAENTYLELVLGTCSAPNDFAEHMSEEA